LSIGSGLRRFHAGERRNEGKQEIKMVEAVRKFGYTLVGIRMDPACG
jgi:hypothetical protein